MGVTVAQTIHKVRDVYGISRGFPGNYVVRDDVDGTFLGALTESLHIVVHGSSKQGKTSVRKYNLNDDDYVAVVCQNRWTLGQLHSAILKAAGYRVEGTTTQTVSGENKINAKFSGEAGILGFKAKAEAGGETLSGSATEYVEAPMELDPFDVNEIIEALLYAKAPKFIVLDDFHYLPEQTQLDFAMALKAFHEVSEYTFVIAGVWLDENRLLQYNGDLGGRVLSINADKWTRKELNEVIQEGAKMLNIKFSDKFTSELLDGSFDSVWVVQDACRRACDKAGINATVPQLQVVDADAEVLVRESVAVHSARFNGFMLGFSLGFQTTRLEMHRWILYAVLSAPIEDLERGLSYAEVTELINSAHPDAPINPGNITQALTSSTSLQVIRHNVKPPVLDYDQSLRRLNVVDRSFLIWLQHQNRNELISSFNLTGPLPAYVDDEDAVDQKV
ncbi:hypothetical protein DXK94_03180 [Arthrobacter sp. RT-1]|nr:hypothetical protein DXK94_03180 [Arthrobacter sp. RT-1]